jgi:hypothetical protein
MIAELTQRMSGVEELLRGVGQGISGLDERMRVRAEHQTKLVELLFPAHTACLFTPRGSAGRLSHQIAPKRRV